VTCNLVPPTAIDLFNRFLHREKVLAEDPHAKSAPPRFKHFFDRGNMKQLDSRLSTSVASRGIPSWEDARSVRSQASVMKEELTRRMQQQSSTSSGAAPGGDGTKQHQLNMWSGSWMPLPIVNKKRAHNWLPNEHFGSVHLSICADIYIDNEYLNVEWEHS